MGRPSKIDQLPAEVRDLIADLRGRGHTIDNIMVALRGLDLPADDLPSRSGVGRHVEKFDAIIEQARRSRAIAEAVIARAADEPESRAARANIELTHTLVMNLMGKLAEDGDDVQLGPQDIQFVAKALDHLGRASKSDVELRKQIRADLAAEADKKLLAAVGKGGMSAEVAAEARRIMGFSE